MHCMCTHLCALCTSPPPSQWQSTLHLWVNLFQQHVGFPQTWLPCFVVVPLKMQPSPSSQSESTLHFCALRFEQHFGRSQTFLPYLCVTVPDTVQPSPPGSQSESMLHFCTRRFQQHFSRASDRLVDGCSRSGPLDGPRITSLLNGPPRRGSVDGSRIVFRAIDVRTKAATPMQTRAMKPHIRVLRRRNVQPPLIPHFRSPCLCGQFGRCGYAPACRATYMGHGLAAKPQAIRYFPDAALMLDPPAVRTWPSSRDQDVSVLPAAMLV